MEVFIAPRPPDKGVLFLKLWLLATLTRSECCGSTQTCRLTSADRFIRQQYKVCPEHHSIFLTNVCTEHRPRIGACTSEHFSIFVFSIHFLMSGQQKTFDNPQTKPSLYSLQPDALKSANNTKRRELAKDTKFKTLQRFQDEFPQDFAATQAGTIGNPPRPPGGANPRPLVQYDARQPWINVVPCDPLEAAHAMKLNGEGKVAVLNPTDPMNPNGWAFGQDSIEASFCHRSLLSLALKEEWYKPRFHPDKMASTTRIRVFSLQAGVDNVLPHNEHFPVDFLSVSVPVKPELTSVQIDGKTVQRYTQDSTATIMRQKLEKVLKWASSSKATLVLCPFGCEEKFGHPARAVSELIRDTLLGNGNHPPQIDWRSFGLRRFTRSAFIEYHIVLLSSSTS